MISCELTRQHLGAARDLEAAPVAAADAHLENCSACRSWMADVDHSTRALRLHAVEQPSFVDAALAMWDDNTAHVDGVRHTVGRLLLAVASLGCLIVGVFIAADSAGHTHIGVTAQREVIILEVALALGLACAAMRPHVFLAGVLPVLGIVAVVNVAVSVVNVVSGNGTLLAEIAHIPFALGLLGAYLVHRTERNDAIARTTRQVAHIS